MKLKTACIVRALILLLVWTLWFSPQLMAQLRVHRIDKLGERSETSPRFDHTEAREAARVVFPKIAELQGWDFSQASDSKIFTDEGLKDIDVVIFDNNTGVLFNDAEKRAFENWVRKGGGVVGIHGAVHAHKGVNENNEAEWPFWYGMWGVLHKTGPKRGPQGARGYADWIEMKQGIDPRWTRGLPRRWRLEMVEWYFWNYHSNYEKTHVIALGEVQENQPGLPENYPVTWNHEYEGGRVWYTNIGHYAENFRQKEFIQHIVHGVDWVAEE